MREIVGFVMGAAAGAAGALFASSTEGRALIERIRDEARPEVDRATTEWEPVLREVGRAVRLAARELETATADLRSRIGEIAAALPDEPASAASQASEEMAPAVHDVAPEAAAEPAVGVAADAIADGESSVQPAIPELTTDAATATPPPAGGPVTDATTPGA